jgi:hypothetical protein
MCFGCKNADISFIHHICEYKCKINNEVSEIVDTYFNESEQLIKCPLMIGGNYGIKNQ